ncbi:caspase domain-containing protein [Mycena rebaudengoi]|nr:caspase domain-containing protein [Mycena rebaudengoi]
MILHDLAVRAEIADDAQDIGHKDTLEFLLDMLYVPDVDQRISHETYLIFRALARHPSLTENLIETQLRTQLVAPTSGFRPTGAFQVLSQVGLGLAPRRRRALIIGVRDPFPEWLEALDGPHQDARSLKSLLINIYGYMEEDISILIDDSDLGPDSQPTYVNILRQLDLFMMDQKPGDKFVFGYSGHSQQKTNLDGTKENRLDSFLLPSDSSDFLKKDYSKVILEDVLQEKLVKSLLPGSQLVTVLDTCHAAGLLELPHSKCNRTRSPASRVRRSIRSVSELLPEINAIPAADTEIFARAGAQSPEELNTHLRKGKCSGYCRRPSTPMDVPVLCISACKSSQTVHDDLDGKSLMRAFVEYLNERPYPTLSELMDACGDKAESTKREIRVQFGHSVSSWQPQLSSLEPLDMTTIFTL